MFALVDPVEISRWTKPSRMKVRVMCWAAGCIYRTVAYECDPIMTLSNR